MRWSAFLFIAAVAQSDTGCAAAPKGREELTIASPLASVASSTPSSWPIVQCAPSKRVCGAAGCLYAKATYKADAPTAQSFACEAGDAVSCTALGVRVWFGDGVPGDVVKARGLLDRACGHHDTLGCVDAAKLKSGAFESFARMCDEGVGEACLEAGNAIRFGAAASAHTPAEGARFYERGCDRGVANACARLAFHAGTGLAMPKNDARMFQLYGKACHCGDDTGCSGQAFGYRDGRGVRQDFERARTTFAALCKRGTQASCVHLGYMYEKGMGMTVDLDMARSLYDSACDARSTDPEGSQGCYMLGKLYRDARGVPQDDSRAFNLFDQGCRIQQASSCGELGRWYRDGRHVTKDPKRALELFDSACSHGEEDGCRDADALRASP